MKEQYRIQAEPVCRKENIIQGADYRISVLTAGLVRLEYSEKGIFEDRPTQVVWNRDLGVCDYQVTDTADSLEISTDRIHLHYDKKRFCADGLYIKVEGGFLPEENVWHYGDTINADDGRELRGTTRTLDGADGVIPLADGLVSLRGYAVMDDSASLIIREDGWIEARREQVEDLYFWGYGTDYLTCIQDFYRLCGTTPMVPRYALGNWWSRYHKYTEESYRELIERFAAEKIPFAVAVIDMDWHLVDVDEKYGSGWTGYTWNRELFPDPAGFLGWLHERNLHVTLNVHPADGVRAYEDQYDAMSRAMGMSDADRENGLPVAFDVSDEEFMEAYFTVLHHPQEADGIDFWWIDWQQGTESRLEGLDPLWMLNHYHFLDNARDGKRPMTFSRYAGPGSHRYPVGFSGDTIVTWESLDFQPYFTASATNIGYGMWSHDIGGHMQGVKDDELSGRWVQYGVFSPIMRLHSTNSRFNSKEPWRFRPEIRAVMEEFLRLRHRMIPYLYAMNYRQYAEGIPLVLPMYYAYPGAGEAYQVPDQYLFGSGLMVAAITTPCIRSLRMAKVDAWIPEGMWYDIFTGLRYRGGRKMSLYRDLTSIPVLAKAGTVIPLQEDYMESADENPAQLHLYVYTGADGAFTLYEDDNRSNDYQRETCVRTRYSWQEEGGCLRIGSADGELSLIPERRDYIITFCGIERAQITAEAGSEGGSGAGRSAVAQAVDSEGGRQMAGTFSVVMKNVPVNEETVLYLRERVRAENNVAGRCFQILDRAEIAFDLKESVFNVIESQTAHADLPGQLDAMELDRDLYGALAEVITAE